MQTFRVTFQLKSAVASAFQADTIFGHLCWAKRYLDGEDGLTKEFLEWYGKDVGLPPILISDGFPCDLLPRPLTPPREPTSGSKQEQIEAYDKQKDLKSIQFLSPDEFNLAIHGKAFEPTKKDSMSKKNVTSKNQINRLTGTTGEGGQLFEFEETWERTPVSIYVKVANGFEDEAERLFRFVAEQGYGKRKSVGYGAIKSMDFQPFDGFRPPADANGYISLSHFVPAKDDPREGCWKVLVKYGKLGEEYAAGENPFKRPLVMLAPGSVFRTEGKPKEFYGRLVPDISSKDGVVQYAFAFPVPMKIV